MSVFLLSALMVIPTVSFAMQTSDFCSEKEFYENRCGLVAGVGEYDKAVEACRDGTGNTPVKIHSRIDGKNVVLGYACSGPMGGM